MLTCLVTLNSNFSLFSFLDFYNFFREAESLMAARQVNTQLVLRRLFTVGNIKSHIDDLLVRTVETVRLSSP